MGRDELLRNEESRALTVELDATLCPGARGRGERLSEATKIITSDRVLELGEANETIRWVWDRVNVDQKDLDERRNRPSWRQSRESKQLRTDVGTRSGCRRLRRLKKQGAGTEASISRNGIDNTWRVSIGNAS